MYLHSQILTFTAVFCDEPTVADGTVTCSSAADGSTISTPTHLDTCSVTCNTGYTPSQETATCTVSDNNGMFDGTLRCEGTELHFDIPKLVDYWFTLTYGGVSLGNDF